MVQDTLAFKCALITGGGGGLGFAMAEFFLSEGKQVIIAGRTEDKLVAASKKLKDAPYYVLDTGSIADIKPFVEKIVKEHPELDCLVNNAGVQRPLDVNNLDLDAADQELNINVRGPIHLATHLLPHFKAKPYAVVMNVTSVLGFVPYSILNPLYNGTKSLMHSWSYAQRTQLKDTSVRIIEIVPPSVGTDLHRDRVDPDDNKNTPNSLTVEQFMKETIEGFRSNADTISAGSGKQLVAKWKDAFDEQFNKAASAWKGMPKKE